MNVSRQFPRHRNDELRATSEDIGRFEGLAFATQGTASTRWLIFKFRILQANSKEYRQDTYQDQSRK